ncbi:MAG: aldo/keto reductase [Acidimicrobiales bacterium]|jgi:aryl-alcohol dehydrogenase-like predicted oxidoreductase
MSPTPGCGSPEGSGQACSASPHTRSAIVEAQWTAERRALERPWTEQPTYSVLTPGHRTRCAAHLRPPRLRRPVPQPLAGGWLSGRYRKDEQSRPAATARPQNRFDLSLPENQRKLDAAEALAQLADRAGITLIELAIAFVLRHPAITSAIIGPRTMGHLESQLTATEVQLTHDVLDAIDTIVGPGVTLNPADDGWVPPALAPAARRR